VPFVAASIRIGTCSWADESLTKYFYPSEIKGAEERLRYYADRFDTVEANSTYYHLPAREMVERWAERTPGDFVMHVKAFGVMTRHPVKLEQLPTDLREDAPVDSRGRVERPSREFRGEIFRRFREALEPLRDEGKLGGILMQFPSYIVPKPASFEYLEWAKEQLRGDELLVEFRHAAWLDEENRAETLAFLERNEMTYVIVDAPPLEGRNVLPTVVATTSSTAYVRFHGRNTETWNKRVRSAAERFDYLYSEEELAEWVEPLSKLSSAAENVYAMFNNNGRSMIPSPGLGEHAEGETVAQAPVNAQMMRSLLEREGLPVAPAPAAA
jgi:uncharacterized protein YecE (DUF72 family)